MAALDPAIDAMLFEDGHAHRGAKPLARFAWRCWDAALDLLFPPHCSSCDVPLSEFINKAVCKKCASMIRWIGTDRCMRCGDSVGVGMGAVGDCVSCRAHPPRFIEATAAVMRYEDGPGRDLILGLKFGGKSHLAKTLGKILASRIRQTGLLDGNPETILIPTPLMRGALFKRGYNQAEELAQFAADDLGLKVETNLLKKIRATQPQALLTEKKRRENLLGAFACDPKRSAKYAGGSVLLIDDVITTGSTVSECARTLHLAGISRVFAASFARG